MIKQLWVLRYAFRTDSDYFNDENNTDPGDLLASAGATFVVMSGLPTEGPIEEKFQEELLAEVRVDDDGNYSDSDCEPGKVRVDWESKGGTTYVTWNLCVGEEVVGVLAAELVEFV